MHDKFDLLVQLMIFRKHAQLEFYVVASVLSYRLQRRFGFRYEPQLKISVTPYVGEQQIAISQLSKLIEDKIVEEVMVSPCSGGV